MAWLDTQVARGRLSSAEAYLVELVEQARTRQEWLKQARRAIEDARSSGDSRRPPAALVASLGAPAPSARDPACLAALRADIAAARAGGLSDSGLADILHRVLEGTRPAPAQAGP